MQSKWTFLALLLCARITFAQSPAISPVELSCEYRQNPLGIDAPAPRLSWMIGGNGRQLRQSAYEIEVGTTAKGNGNAFSGCGRPGGYNENFFLPFSVRYGQNNPVNTCL